MNYDLSTEGRAALRCPVCGVPWEPYPDPATGETGDGHPTGTICNRHRPKSASASNLSSMAKSWFDLICWLTERFREKREWDYGSLLLRARKDGHADELQRRKADMGRFVVQRRVDKGVTVRWVWAARDGWPGEGI